MSIEFEKRHKPIINWFYSDISGAFLRYSYVGKNVASHVMYRYAIKPNLCDKTTGVKRNTNTKGSIYICHIVLVDRPTDDMIYMSNINFFRETFFCESPLKMHLFVRNNFIKYLDKYDSLLHARYCLEGMVEKSSIQVLDITSRIFISHNLLI